MSKNKTYTIFALTTIGMFVAVGMFVFMFREIKFKNENTSLMSKRLDKKNMQKNDLVNLSKTIEDTKKQREILGSYIVDEKSIDEFIGWLEERGNLFETNVIVNSVSRLPEGGRLGVTMTISGSFNSVLNFSSFLENSSYKINIEKLFLTKIIEEFENFENKENLKKEYWQSQITFSLISEDSSKK